MATSSLRSTGRDRAAGQGSRFTCQWAAPDPGLKETGWCLTLPLGAAPPTAGPGPPSPPGPGGRPRILLGAHEHILIFLKIRRKHEHNVP